MHILDNQCSAEFKEKILENKIEYQLVPPHNHRRNIAEKVIQVFKDHFLSGLCGTDDKFPMKLWCRIPWQAEHQLNMLRVIRVDPSKSSFEVLNGSHDYNVNPFALLRCKVETHGVPSKRKSWEAHTKAGFYLGNSWEHYRCHEIWIMDTRSVRVGQTVFFKHKYLTQPSVTPLDAVHTKGTRQFMWRVTTNAICQRTSSDSYGHADGHFQECWQEEWKRGWQLTCQHECCSKSKIQVRTSRRPSCLLG